MFPEKFDNTWSGSWVTFVRNATINLEPLSYDSSFEDKEAFVLENIDSINFLNIEEESDATYDSVVFYYSGNIKEIRYEFDTNFTQKQVQLMILNILFEFNIPETVSTLLKLRGQL